ncbi:hypothetical protein BKD30_09175 [Tersicoccus phoenicis]|uniref:Esterase n=1 Tax=Tersicoccus phoenicis TaxID=554083 RepID=A0A1R1L9A4_9MICC|nr:alpha/beta hydrolase-fold protein [Tersicoccus phoenicis]OMH24079.1 hypothetical protein BKD30_09175 [Tersicoccus phoenicis]
MDTWLQHVSVVDGWLPITVLVLAVCAVLALLVRRRARWWWWLLVVLVVPVAIGVAYGISVLLVDVLSVWPEALPDEVVLWGALGVGGLLLAVLAVVVPRFRWWRLLVAPVAVVLVAATAALQINAYYGLFATAADVLGRTPPVAAGIPPALSLQGRPAFDSAGVSTGWRQPAGMATTGVFRRIAIPGTVSRFTGGQALVYLPGAYLLPNRPKLPVLVLVAGQPGVPANWIAAGQIREVVDAFAARHQGLAPVVVMPDPNGTVGNTMCMNTALGAADTYMAVDVPNWITRTLDVDGNPAHWAVGGFSYGGTCAIQMGTRHPERYRSVIALGSEREPALSVDRRVTVGRAFGGDTSAFDRLLPMTLLRHRNYPTSTAFFAAGSADPVYQANARVLEAAARASGMRTELDIVPGVGHSYVMVRAALPRGLAFVARSLGLSR